MLHRYALPCYILNHLCFFWGKVGGLPLMLHLSFLHASSISSLSPSPPPPSPPHHHWYYCRSLYLPLLSLYKPISGSSRLTYSARNPQTCRLLKPTTPALRGKSLLI
ncbi:hypothetical protein K440DRAFT_221013 [Wilcoxina mikolae CBS 423.85]|nr:hypothetical protein K440DRAFT_221013 [Wilcoxina mikolae CBS 423.85]